jgi:4-hydroxy 2-oxovalerate aldolase
MIIDSSLRDGSHAVNHQLNEEQIEIYSKAADEANIPIVIVGHGNGLGASSLQVGESFLPDIKMIRAARKRINKSKLGVFIIPGFGTINKDLSKAIDEGVDVVCVGSHCTETDITQRHIEYARQRNVEVFGVLMMTHMITKEDLLEKCLKTQAYGALGVILMDSAGAYLPIDVKEKVSILVDNLKIPIGFHAHNNLGLAVANSLEAVKSGARLIDGCSRGFGAGAGNAPLEIIVAILSKIGYSTGIDLYKMFDLADIAEKKIIKDLPITKSISIVSGLAGVFSGFAKHVSRVSLQYDVDPRDVFFELGKKKVVAGQEDIIIEVAMALKEKRGAKGK